MVDGDLSIRINLFSPTGTEQKSTASNQRIVDIVQRYQAGDGAEYRQLFYREIWVFII